MFYTGVLLRLCPNVLLTESPICVCSQPISSTWYDYWGADYGTYGYNPYIGGVGIPVAKPPVAAEKPGSQGLSVSVSQGESRPRQLQEPSADCMQRILSRVTPSLP